MKTSSTLLSPARYNVDLTLLSLYESILRYLYCTDVLVYINASIRAEQTLINVTNERLTLQTKVFDKHGAQV